MPPKFAEKTHRERAAVELRGAKVGLCWANLFMRGGSEEHGLAPLYRCGRYETASNMDGLGQCRRQAISRVPPPTLAVHHI